MEDLINQLSPAHVAYATAAWVLLQSLGRAYAAIVKGGGLKGIWSGLIFGTNTPRHDPPPSGISSDSKNNP